MLSSRGRYRFAGRSLQSQFRSKRSIRSSYLGAAPFSLPSAGLPIRSITQAVTLKPITGTSSLCDWGLFDQVLAHITPSGTSGRQQSGKQHLAALLGKVRVVLCDLVVALGLNDDYF